MGEDVARAGTRTHRRRWALLIAVGAAVVVVVGGFGGARAADERDDRAELPAAAPAKIVSVRGNSPAPAVTSSVPVPSPVVVSTTEAPVAPPVATTPVAPVAPAQTVPEPVAPAPVVRTVAEPTPPPAAPSAGLDGWVRRTDLEADLFARHNTARADAGLAPYSEGPCLTGVAVRWARTMADRSMLAHNPNHVGQILACSSPAFVGENVGVGYAEAGGIAGVFDAFMASPTHWANIVDAEFTQVGIGVWSSADGTIRVAVNFATP